MPTHQMTAEQIREELQRWAAHAAPVTTDVYYAYNTDPGTFQVRPHAYGTAVGGVPYDHTVTTPTYDFTYPPHNIGEWADIPLTFEYVATPLPDPEPETDPCTDEELEAFLFGDYKPGGCE